ncbi:uncharacterized protein LOC130648608 [Hydractinia symbiolongicarpus]|uniref:uncharacterized protein LOC130648608 n=1 Tax=Hydractinia symbiolongicarpus TaxID=13093 RepID=UPI00254A0CF5|nr:uncharacterized protein LOC130648608 [Hydractinia symbiolongicarpus]
MANISGLDLFILVFAFLPLPGNILNVIFILTKERLHIPIYYIVIAIAVTDTIFAVSASTSIILQISTDVTNSSMCMTCNDQIKSKQANLTIIFHVATKTTFLISIFCTVLLAIDRFIAIKYCLAYYQVVTSCKVFCSVMGISIAATLTTVIPFGKQPKLVSAITSRSYKNHVVSWCLMLISMVTVFSIAIHTNSMRQRNIKVIKSKKVNTGHNAQQLTILRRLKQSLKDLIRIYIITVIFTGLHVLSSILRLYVDQSFYKLNGIISFIYMMLNPYLFILTMTELRNVHRLFWSRVFVCLFSKNNIVTPMDTPTISSANNRALPSNNIGKAV